MPTSPSVATHADAAVNAVTAATAAEQDRHRDEVSERLGAKCVVPAEELFAHRGLRSRDQRRRRPLDHDERDDRRECGRSGEHPRFDGARHGDGTHRDDAARDDEDARAGSLDRSDVVAHLGARQPRNARAMAAHLGRRGQDRDRDADAAAGEEDAEKDEPGEGLDSGSPLIARRERAAQDEGDAGESADREADRPPAGAAAEAFAEDPLEFLVAVERESDRAGEPADRARPGKPERRKRRRRRSRRRAWRAGTIRAIRGRA